MLLKNKRHDKEFNEIANTISKAQRQRGRNKSLIHVELFDKDMIIFFPQDSLLILNPGQTTDKYTMEFSKEIQNLKHNLLEKLEVDFHKEILTIDQFKHKTSTDIKNFASNYRTVNIFIGSHSGVDGKIALYNDFSYDMKWFTKQAFGKNS